MIEPFVLPALLVVMIGLVAYVWFAWLRRKDQRALGEFDPDDDNRRAL